MIERKKKDFPDSPVAKTLPSQCRALRFRELDPTGYKIQLRVQVPQLRIPHAMTKTEDLTCWSEDPAQPNK